MFFRPQSQSSSIRRSQFKCPSISPVPSLNKQTNRVYEKWPDYDHISQIVGYRIEPPPPLKPVLSNSLASRPSQSNSQRKSNKSTGFSNASKQIKTALGLSASPARRRSSKLQSISLQSLSIRPNLYKSFHRKKSNLDYQLISVHHQPIILIEFKLVNG